jgi:hypothetical protein
LKREFGGEIKLDLLMKNIDNSQQFYRSGVDQVGFHIPECIGRSELERMLGLS